MNDIDIALKAKNSSGEQKLHLTEDCGEYSFTLLGDFNGDKIQIDFDCMRRSELEDMRAQIDIILSC